MTRLARWLLVLVAASGACGRDSDPKHEILLVAAASSLRQVLEDTRSSFEAAHPGTRVRFAFEASSTLARQIAEGAPFDAFLSADAETVEQVRVRGEIVPATVVTFLSNRLALVRRKDLPDPASRPADLASRNGRVAVAGPAVPAGRYARAYLEKAGLLAAVQSRLASTDNVRAALALVESGAADYAFVYETDAKIARNAVLAWVDQAGDAPDILYVAAVMKRNNAAAARAYVEWLGSSAFLGAAESRGFRKP